MDLHPAWLADSLHQELVLLLGDGEQIFQFLRIDSEAFLAEDVLTAKKRTFGVLVVEVMGCSDIDSVDILVTISVTASPTIHIPGEVCIREGLNTYRVVVDFVV